MAIEIVVPALGESVTEATVGQWFKKPGDLVKADEPLVELETDKVTVEVPAPATGVLGDIKVAQGATVAIGAVLGSIEAGAGSPRSKPRGEAGAPAAKPATAPPAQPQPAAKSPPAGKPSPERTAPPPAPPRADAASAMPPAPAARKLLEEKGMAAADVAGSGRRGQVLKQDVIAAAAKPAQVAPAEAVAHVAPMATPPVPMQQMRAPSVPNDAAREERARVTR